MLHKTRAWSLSTVETAEELAVKLTEMTWCGCSAFKLPDAPYIFVNDSTSADGAQEYAILKPDGSECCPGRDDHLLLVLPRRGARLHPADRHRRVRQRFLRD